MYILIVLLALTGAVIVLYNRLIRSRNRVDTAWSDVDVQLQRRHDLIPQLVKAVDAYAKYESATLEAVAEAGIEASIEAVADAPVRSSCAGVPELVWPSLEVSAPVVAVPRQSASAASRSAAVREGRARGAAGLQYHA